MKKVKFNAWDCVITVGRYRNDRIALELVDPEDGEPIAIATVNLPEEELGPDEIFIKDWSENEGMYTALKDAGIIGPILEEIPSGFVNAYRVKLLIPLEELA